MEYILQTAICGIPDFDTGWMRCDKSVEDGVVEDAQTGILVCQVVIDGLVIIIKDQATASYNNPLGRLRDSQGMDLIQAAVKCLCCRVSSHVPNPDHARNVCTDDLLSASDPLYTDKTVVMTLHYKDFWLDLRVPHVDIVIETGTEDHVHVCIPVQCVHSELMTLGKFVLKSEIIHFPKCDDSVHTT